MVSVAMSPVLANVEWQKELKNLIRIMEKKGLEKKKELGKKEWLEK